LHQFIGENERATRRPTIEEDTDEIRHSPCLQRDHRGLRLWQQLHHPQHQGERPHRVEVCSQCHPFYTGKQKILDSGGRVARFEKRYGKRNAGGEKAGDASASEAADN